MDSNDPDDPGGKTFDEASAAVNSLVLDYYKKFGRKRDLEQYFSLSTADSEVRDVSSVFWTKMKSQDSSDSGEKKSESSTEVCRISIKCSVHDPCSSQDENTKTKSDTDSPPIITEEVETRHTDDEFANEDNQSQQSMDALLDTSINKPLSPTSSITSQRKLEWDSLADVGYANESDRKGSASSLSTLERLALKQQYSNNDTQRDTKIGLPTAHSTPVDIDVKSKNKKGATKKTTKIYQKDIDIVEVNMPQGSEAKSAQSINVNLTKHISFNMDKDGSVSVENVSNDVNVTPNKDDTEKEAIPAMKTDKEIQTSLTKSKEKSASSDLSKSEKTGSHKIPVLISLNTLRKRYRRKKSRAPRRKPTSKPKSDVDKENIPIQEKSTEQVSAAESFEYMPGHVYNQNQMNLNPPASNNTDNKSSLESSGALTTDSSKSSKHSFTKDLERSIEILKMALQKHHNDSELKNKLVKEVVQRLLKARYRDDDSTTEFLSGLSFSSKKLGLREERTLTTSTSDSNNTEIKHKVLRPKKSILRLDKFNSNVLASTSQSAPNLPAVSSNENPVIPSPLKHMTSNTESDISSGGKNSSDTAFAKTSSEELYQKYLEALKREEAYKKHLKDKEQFLKQKLVSSDTACRVSQSEVKVNNRLKDLINDLTRNNYDDGSGDASKLEGGSNGNVDFHRPDTFRNQRSHSVFTLSSGNSDENRKANLKKRLQNEIKQSRATHIALDKHCCCPHHFVASKVGVVDSSVQVNICEEHSLEKDRHQGHIALPCNIHQHNQEPLHNVHVVPDDLTGEIKYVCLCNKKSAVDQEAPENMLIYKCSRLTHKAVQPKDSGSSTSNTIGVQCMGSRQSSPRQDIKCQPSTSKNTDNDIIYSTIHSNKYNTAELEKNTKSSQTNIALKILERKTISRSSSPPSSEKQGQGSPLNTKNKQQSKDIIYEVTRCVQTEISINPRIPDPSLTDVNILSDGETVRVISEHSRQIIKPTSDGDFKNNNSNAIHSNLRTFEIPEQSSNANINTDNNEIQTCFELNNNELPASPIPEEDYSTDNFKIPIQGTNMTLMVSIGSKHEDKKNYGVCTDKAEISEKATCLPEECSKGVQSNAVDIFATIDREPIIPVARSPQQSPRKDDCRQAFYQQCTVKACTTSDANRHTYPRSVQINPKPFLRSNTDTGKFVSVGSAQTDSMDEKYCTPTRDTDSESASKSKVSSVKSSSRKSHEAKDTSSEAPSRKSSSDDPIIDIIKDITRRYTKKDTDKVKKKKCYKEIMHVLSYLLNTEDGTDPEKAKLSESSSARETDGDCSRKVKERDKLSLRSRREKFDSDEQLKSGGDHSTDTKTEKVLCDCHKKIQNKVTCKCHEKQNIAKEEPTKEDKAVQSSLRSSSRRNYTESSEIQATTEIPSTSSESATCKVLSKIKRECEKYHQRRCKCHGIKKCEASSSTSVTCEQCKKVHHCPCKGHRCHRTKSSVDKMKKKCVAYNLIIQSSDSMVCECEEPSVSKDTRRTLKNIVVKVPQKRKQMESAPFKEVYTKIEKTIPPFSPRNPILLRSNSLPNESDISGIDDSGRRRNKVYSCKDYLEINRPDFVQKSSDRQECLKRISEARANQRAAHRQLLSVQLDRRPSLTSLSESDLHQLARSLGMDLRRKKVAPKFISEHEMKKHSEKIYKSLPEVVQKKEEAKKENVKKTNLLMANMFKKNLQKKTLRGSVNLSNYSTVIKI